jgi:predicted CoA-binding protein
MKAKLLAATVVVVGAFTTPALADFWIVQDSSTKHCSIVEQRPTTTATTIVGDREFKTRAEADSQMKRVEVCRESTTGGPARAPAR